jgi:hypothetical protein
MLTLSARRSHLLHSRRIEVAAALAIAALLTANPAHSIASYVGSKIDPPTLAPLGSGVVRVLAFAQEFSESVDLIEVCAPPGVTLATPLNVSGNQPPLAMSVSGNCATATAHTPTNGLQSYAVDFPFDLSPSFDIVRARNFDITVRGQDESAAPAASLPIIYRGSGPVPRIASSVHSALDPRFPGLCVVNSDCWFQISVFNDGDAPLSGWTLADQLPFSCSSVATSLRGALPTNAPSRTASGFDSLLLNGPTVPAFSNVTFLINCLPLGPARQASNLSSLSFRGQSQSDTVLFSLLGVPPGLAFAKTPSPADLMTQTAFFGTNDDRMPEAAPGDAFFFVTTVSNVGGSATEGPLTVQGLLNPDATSGVLTVLSSSSYIFHADNSSSPRLPCAQATTSADSCQTASALQPGDTAVVIRLVKVNGVPPGGALQLADASFPLAGGGIPFSSGNIVSFAVLPSLAGSCVEDGNHLCLQDQRVELGAAWTTYGSPPQSGVGTPVPLSPSGTSDPDTGYFWFFDPSNVEIMAKALNGAAVNNEYWVFYGALSSVEYVLTARDTTAGAVRAYFNPNGQVASNADTSAFSLAPPADLAHFMVPTAPVCPLAKINASGGCQAGENNLCLLGGRFRVSITWQTPDGSHGQGNAVALTGDTGYFWFFSDTNAEVVVKTLDGTAVNGKFWVFFGALSDVAYTITVTDTSTGRFRTYANTQGTLTSLADTSAF